MSCGDTISDCFLVITGVRQGSVLAPTFFNTYMDHVLSRMSEKSGCGVWFGLSGSLISTWGISMQPLALTEMAISHVLLLTALE